MDFALVHVAHSRIQQRLNCLSQFLRAKPDLAENLANSFSWDENEMVCIGLFKSYHSHWTCGFFRYAIACFCICLWRLTFYVRLVSWLREGKSDRKLFNDNKIIPTYPVGRLIAESHASVHVNKHFFLRLLTLLLYKCAWSVWNPMQRN